MLNAGESRISIVFHVKTGGGMIRIRGRRKKQSLTRLENKSVYERFTYGANEPFS